MAKRTTKNDRLLALFDVVYAMHGRKPISMDTVVEWADAQGLLPVPGIRDPLAECEAWDQKFSKARAEGDQSRG